MGRWVMPAVLVAGALVLQATVAARLAVLGAAPDLVMVAVISIAVLRGPAAGGICGFGAGMARDLLLSAPAGLGGLTYLLVGYGIGSASPALGGGGLAASGIGTLAGSLFESVLHAALLASSGQRLEPASGVAQAAVVGSLSSAALALVVHPVIRSTLGAPAQEVAYRP